MLNRICESDPRTLSIFSTYNSVGIKPVVNPTFPVKDNKLPSSKSILPHARNDNIWDEDRKQMKAFFLQFRFTSKDYAAAKIYWTVDTCCLTGSRYRYIYLYTYSRKEQKETELLKLLRSELCRNCKQKIQWYSCLWGMTKGRGFLDFGFQKKKKKKDRGIQCGGPHLETLEMVVWEKGYKLNG